MSYNPVYRRLHTSHDIETGRVHRLAIAATFTAEPLEEAMDFWMGELELPASIEFAPYNQVFQQLLDPGSLLSQNRQGVNVVLVRLEDWVRSRPGSAGHIRTSRRS